MKFLIEQLNSLPARSYADILNFDKFYLFGISESAYDVKRWLLHHNKKIIGYLDNSSEKQGKTYDDGIEISAPDILKSGVASDTAIIISCSYQVEIAHQLIKELGICKKKVFPFISEMFQNHFGKDSIVNNIDNINWLIERVSDFESKQYIYDLVIFRWTMDPLLLRRNPKVIGFYQYDDLETDLKPGDVIIDCGAYTGDTAQTFLKRMNGHGHIYAIEPLGANFKALKEWIYKSNNESKVTPIKCAVGTEKGRIEIASSSGIDPKANARTNTLSVETESVVVRALDEINEIKNTSKVDMIKVDVEGFEPDVLIGASKTIKKYQPILLLAGYHIPEHLWSLPMMIEELGLEYNIRVGHHPAAPYEPELFCTLAKKS